MHGVDDELRILVDHHRARSSSPRRHVSCLSIDRRDLKLEFGERSEHAAGEVRCAADWPDAEPQAARPVAI
jgi:hypothetical protein